MFNSGMTIETLRDCLVTTAPLDLLGMRLLQTCPKQGLYPTDLTDDLAKSGFIFRPVRELYRAVYTDQYF